jgi:hypothetical protein
MRWLDSITKPIRSGELGRWQPKGNIASGMGVRIDEPKRRRRFALPAHSMVYIQDAPDVLFGWIFTLEANSFGFTLCIWA